MFSDIHEVAENTAYLKAVEEKDVSLEILNELPPYDDLHDLEAHLKTTGRLTFQNVFHEPTGYYFIQQFLISDYSGEKGVFVRDVENYQKMRAEIARKRVARMIYERFVAEESLVAGKYPKNLKHVSTFEILQRRERERKMRASQMGRELDEISDTPEPSNVEQLLHIGQTNAIGVYGRSVQHVREIIEAGKAPVDLFDEVAVEVLSDLQLDVFPRFLKSSPFRKYVRTKAIERKMVGINDFTTLRVLGRGGFGTVHACRKNDSGVLYAMKCMHKKVIKSKRALNHIMEEREVLALLDSPFVTTLKYALQDADYLYLIMDLLLGGDMKFHLSTQGSFGETRSRYHAAEILLGLEHIHSKNIIYRDLKLENVLLDDYGHCRISDFGLAVITTEPTKHYAGTPGYCAPEMVRNEPYGPSVDIFSFGVLLYRMIYGHKPFKGNGAHELDRAVLKKEPKFPPDKFSPEATSLLSGLLEKDPKKRLGCGPRGIAEIKEHVFFESIEWGLLEAGYVEPSFVPSRDINAQSSSTIGEFDMAKYGNIRLGTRFMDTVKRFDHISVRALQEELVKVLEKADQDVTFERFASRLNESQTNGVRCCVVQ